MARDYDSNGFPKHERDRIVRTLREAGALRIAGDTHLAMFLIHGLTEYTDGCPQFVVPAAGNRFQRWFEPNAESTGRVEGLGPFCGDFTGAFGSKFRVLAVANPRISRNTLRAAGGGFLLDRRLTANGFGIVRVRKAGRKFVCECWPPDASAGKGQYAGWPISLPFPPTPEALGQAQTR